MIPTALSLVNSDLLAYDLHPSLWIYFSFTPKLFFNSTKLVSNLNIKNCTNLFKIHVLAAFCNSIDIPSAKNREDLESGIRQRMIKPPVKVKASLTMRSVKLRPARRLVIKNLLLLSLQCMSCFKHSSLFHITKGENVTKRSSELKLQ